MRIIPREKWVLDYAESGSRIKGGLHSKGSDGYAAPDADSILDELYKAVVTALHVFMKIGRCDELLLSPADVHRRGFRRHSRREAVWQ